MSQEQLFIPEKIKVGYNHRDDTYSKKLGFVIYYDNKGVLRKKTAWENWCDEKIPSDEFSNAPLDGFVLNKGVGGVRQSYGWNARNEYIRVFDPRGFEIEISVANLLFILTQYDCSRGKGLEGKFVYAWDGKELVLLPVKSEDYKKSKEFTELQGKQVRAKDLIPGATYLTKKQNKLIFLGKLDYHFVVRQKNDYDYNISEYVATDSPDQSGVVKKFVFKDTEDEENKFIFLNEVKTLSVCLSDSVNPKYAKLLDEYNNSPNGSKAVSLVLRETVKTDNLYGENHWFYEESDGVFVECYSEKEWSSTGTKKVTSIHTSWKHSIKNGVYSADVFTNRSYSPGYQPPQRRWQHSRTDPVVNTIPWREPTNLTLFIVLEKGLEIPATSFLFEKR